MKINKRIKYKKFNKWCETLGIDPNSLMSVLKYIKWTRLAGGVRCD